MIFELPSTYEEFAKKKKKRKRKIKRKKNARYSEES